MSQRSKFIKNPWYIMGVLLALLIMQGLIIGISYLFGADLGSSQHTQNYDVTESSSNITQLWTYENIHSFYGTDGGVLLGSTDESAYFLGRFDSSTIKNLSLIKFDLFSGEMLWQSIDNRPAPLGDPLVSGLGVNSDYIYVGFRSTESISGETLSGAAQIRAYDHAAGNLVWAQSIGGARSITSMMVTDNTVSIDGNFSSNYYLLNAFSGRMIDSISKGQRNLMWFIDEGKRYEQTSNFYFQTVDTTTEAIQWHILVGDRVYMPPVLSENHIVIRTKEARFFGDVIVLEKESGRKVWDYQDVLSNVAVDNGTAYFLTEDMRLLGMEISTGKILVEATIQPQAIDSTNNVYQLTVSHDIVVVYFGGGNQLTAFQVSFAD